MNTQHARVTREEAARLAGVSVRQVNRYSAAGLISVERDPYFRKPATYDPLEVIEARATWDRLRAERRGEAPLRTVDLLALPDPD